MYIHIGGEYSLSDKYIIAIIDLNHVQPNQTDMTKYMSDHENMGLIEYISTDIPQSLIITLDRLYVSGLSTHTLIKRIEANKKQVCSDVS